MKMGKVYVLLACLAAGSVLMGQTTINVGTDTGWSGISPKPTSIDTVVIRFDATVTLDEDATVNVLRVNNVAAPTNATFAITQNYELTASQVQLGVSTGAGYVNQSGGSAISPIFTINHSGTGDLSIYNLSGGSVTASTRIDINNQGLLAVSGGTITAPLNVKAGGTFRITGNAADLSGVNLNTSAGLFDFVFGASGISTIGSTRANDLGLSSMTINGSAYVGTDTTFTLFDLGSISTQINTANITVTGFSKPYEITQDAATGIVQLTLIPEPATIGMLGLGALITLVVRRQQRR